MLNEKFVLNSLITVFEFTCSCKN